MTTLTPATLMLQMECLGRQWWSTSSLMTSITLISCKRWHKWNSAHHFISFVNAIKYNIVLVHIYTEREQFHCVIWAPWNSLNWEVKTTNLPCPPFCRSQLAGRDNLKATDHVCSAVGWTVLCNHKEYPIILFITIHTLTFISTAIYEQTFKWSFSPGTFWQQPSNVSACKLPLAMKHISVHCVSKESNTFDFWS